MEMDWNPSQSSTISGPCWIPVRGSHKEELVLCYGAKYACAPGVGDAVRESEGRWSRCKPGCCPTKTKASVQITDILHVLLLQLVPLPDRFSGKNSIAAFTSTFPIPCRMCFVFHSIQKCIAKGILGDVVQLAKLTNYKATPPPSQLHPTPHEE